MFPIDRWANSHNKVGGFPEITLIYDFKSMSYIALKDFKKDKKSIKYLLKICLWICAYHRLPAPLRGSVNPSEPRKQVSQFFTVHVLIQAWRQHLRGTIEARAAAAPGLTLK
ncbi:TPA: hypothetical protein NU545_004368 [Escherichia coli]|nr:hypothetical protein [Escherichia coli]HCJ6130001.1 hypothetical protein [Escherichia coli]